MKTWLLEISRRDPETGIVNVETWEGLPETVFNAGIQKGDVAFVYNCTSQNLAPYLSTV